jgi:adenylate cyclase
LGDSKVNDENKVLLFDLLIEKRINNKIDTEEIDSEIYRIFGREMCVLFTDLCDFTSCVHQYGTVAFLEKMYNFKKIFTPIILKNNGEVIKIEGDSYIAVFEQVDQALITVVEAIKCLTLFNEDKDLPDKIEMCSGIGYGDLLKIGDKDVFGYEVNIASKLGEDLAGAYEIFISEAAKQNVNQLKNIFTFEEVYFDLIKEIKAYKIVSML